MTALAEQLGLSALVLAHGWVLALLPLPWLLRLLLPVWRDRRWALRFPALRRLAADAARPLPPDPTRRLWQHCLSAAAWLLLLLALAAPQRLEPPVTRQSSGRDLMLALDLSGSMETQDFTTPAGTRESRLSAAQAVLRDFIARRPADRIGVIVFGSAAFVLAPFSDDHDTLLELLAEVQPRLAGPQTMIGEAIGLAAQSFEKAEAQGRLLILLTDGNDTGSKVPPLRAAQIAAGLGIRIYAVSMGDPAAVGEAALDIPGLEAIAAAAGGRHFHATDAASLAGIYAEIDRIEPQRFASQVAQPRAPLFHWPLAGFALLAMAALLATAMRREVRHG
ncbi:vWA domain-containing protein [Pseudoroseomonas ludipueritiae]|uniref:VWA domain-containing protein n=1 Tax=Pseudoroseomonas ludipueritiae TaxID=198093 RepID=A0ABR7R201_9PROT|nr:VWA domain-containing protein [Pseudoroseomonas ludipueritiae]MBC9175678.1 VWA domain-containing protein [Pseudoroseomonas ludipueritiae]